MLILMICSLDPARGLASRPHPFGALWQATQTPNLAEFFYILVLLPDSKHFSNALGWLPFTPS